MIMENSSRSRGCAGFFPCHSRAGGNPVFPTPDESTIAYMRVLFETHQDVREAITREKQIKQWNRQWKINLIEENNPEWHNLYEELT